MAEFRELSQNSLQVRRIWSPNLRCTSDVFVSVHAQLQSGENVSAENAKLYNFTQAVPDLLFVPNIENTQMSSLNHPVGNQMP